MPSEQRTQERFSLNLKARISYRFNEEGFSEPVETVAANVSAGGAFFQTRHRLPLSSKVRLEFLLSLDHLKKLRFILSLSSLTSMSGQNIRVRATGIVIRQEGNGVAVIFNNNYQLTPLQPVNDSELIPSR